MTAPMTVVVSHSTRVLVRTMRKHSVTVRTAVHHSSSTITGTSHGLWTSLWKRLWKWAVIRSTSTAVLTCRVVSRDTQAGHCFPHAVSLSVSGALTLTTCSGRAVARRVLTPTLSRTHTSSVSSATSPAVPATRLTVRLS